jgi:hypothetical protein
MVFKGKKKIQNMKATNAWCSKEKEIEKHDDKKCMMFDEIF